MKKNARKKKTHHKIDAAAAGAHDAVDWAAETTNKATDRLSATGHEMKEAPEKWLATARGYAQNNPATSVGIALAGGYLLGCILRTR